MKNKLQNIMNTLKENKKKISKVCIGGVITLICLASIGGFGYYSYIKSNINYSQAEAEAIALQYLAGEVVKTTFDIEDGVLEYEVSVKDENNFLQEVTICSETGAIVDFEKNRR